MITVQIVGPCKLTDRSPISITTVAGPSCSRGPPPRHSLYTGDSLEMLITSITNLTSGLGGPSQTGEDDSSSDLRASLDEFFLITNGVVIFCKYAHYQQFLYIFRHTRLCGVVAIRSGGANSFLRGWDQLIQRSLTWFHYSLW